MKAITCGLSLFLYFPGGFTALPAQSGIVDLMLLKQISSEWLSRLSSNTHNTFGGKSCKTSFFPDSDNLADSINSLEEGCRVCFQPGIYPLNKTVRFQNLQVSTCADMPVYEAGFSEYLVIKDSILFLSRIFSHQDKTKVREFRFNLNDTYKPNDEFVYFVRGRDVDPQQDVQVIFQGMNLIQNVVFISEADIAMGPWIVTSGTVIKHLGSIDSGHNYFSRTLPSQHPVNNPPQRSSGHQPAQKQPGSSLSRSRSLNYRNKKTSATAAGGGGDKPPGTPLSFGDYLGQGKPEVDALIIILRHLLTYIFSYEKGDMEDFIRRLVRVIEYLESAVSVGDTPHYNQHSKEVCINHLKVFAGSVVDSLRALSRDWLADKDRNDLLQLRNFVVLLLCDLSRNPSGRQVLWVSVPLLSENAQPHNFPGVEKALKKEHESNQKIKELYAQVQQKTSEMRRSVSITKALSTASEQASGVSEDFKFLLRLLRKKVSKKEGEEQWSNEAHDLFGLLAQGFDSTAQLMLFAVILGVFESEDRLSTSDSSPLSYDDAYRMLLQLYLLHLHKGGTIQSFVRALKDFWGAQFSLQVARIRSGQDKLGTLNYKKTKVVDHSDAPHTTTVVAAGLVSLLVEFIEAHPAKGASLIPVPDAAIKALAGLLTIHELKRLALTLNYRLHASSEDKYNLLNRIIILYFNDNQSLESFLNLLVEELAPERMEELYEQLKPSHSVKGKPTRCT